MPGRPVNIEAAAIIVREDTGILSSKIILGYESECVSEWGSEYIQEDLR